MPQFGVRCSGFGCSCSRVVFGPGIVVLCSGSAEHVSVFIPVFGLNVCSCSVNGVRLQPWLYYYYSLNMPLAYRVLAYIWKDMRSGGRGSGRSGGGRTTEKYHAFRMSPSKAPREIAFLELDLHFD